MLEEPTLAARGGSTDAVGQRRASGPLARGAELGRYVVLDRLGRGGTGAVYTAFDPKLDRRVAIKVLDPGHDHSVLREAQALARVSHPNVVAVHQSLDVKRGKPGSCSE